MNWPMILQLMPKDRMTIGKLYSLLVTDEVQIISKLTFPKAPGTYVDVSRVLGTSK